MCSFADLSDYNLPSITPLSKQKNETIKIFRSKRKGYKMTYKTFSTMRG